MYDDVRLKKLCVGVRKFQNLLQRVTCWGAV